LPLGNAGDFGAFPIAQEPFEFGLVYQPPISGGVGQKRLFLFGESRVKSYIAR
jgi:hypothetical protein